LSDRVIPSMPAQNQDFAVDKNSDVPQNFLPH